MSTKVKTITPESGFATIGGKTYERVLSVSLTIDTSPIPFLIPMASNKADVELPEIRLVHFKDEGRSMNEAAVAERLAEFLYTHVSGTYMDAFGKAYRKLVNS